MYSWLVTVLLLASAANGSGGAQVPITNYTCTQPDGFGFNDTERCTVSDGLRTCAIAEGASLDGCINIGETYVWNDSTNPFVVLDIPKGWCVESVRMTFVAQSSIPILSLSVHSAERLSTNTDRTMFSLVSEEVTRLVVMNLTALASGKYLRINMTSTGRLFLTAIEVFGTNDSICTHPSSAGGDPVSSTTSVTPASPTTSVTPASPTTSVTLASPPTSVTPIRAQVPITSYTCTQPNLPSFKDHGQCTVSRGLRTCAIKEGVRPDLLNSSADLSTRGLYTWDSDRPLYPNPFVVLDIPQGWCVWSVRMMFVAPSSIPALSLSVHSAERLSTNTDRTMFSLVSEEVTRLAVMNLTTLARGKYLRINMTSTGRLVLRKIEVFGTNDSICTHPSSAVGDPASPTTSVTPASPTTSVTPASPTTSVTPASPTTSVGSSSNSVTPISTSDNSTTSGSTSTPSPSPSPTPSGVPVAPDSYVLPAAISAAAVLLVVVLTAIFVVIICIITRRHKTRKSLDVQSLSRIYYQTTQSDITFKDNQFHTGQSADVPIHDKASVDTNNEISDAPRSYAALGPSKSNDSVFQGAAEEPVAEGAISRPTSQASIRSNKVSSKPSLGMVTRVHPSMVEHPYDRWENTTAGTDESGHYETSLHWQHAGGPYYNLSNCQLPGEDDKHRVAKDAKAQVGKTHQPPSQAPPTASPLAAGSVYANTPVASDKRKDPSTSDPTYANIDPPSLLPSSKLAATRPSKQQSSHPKPLPSVESPRVCQKDHIDKTSASSASSPLPRLTHRSDGTRDYAEVDADLWGGSGNVEGDTVPQPQSITSSSTAKGAVPTQGVTMGHVYAAVDYSKKKSRRGKVDGAH